MRGEREREREESGREGEGARERGKEIKWYVYMYINSLSK